MPRTIEPDFTRPVERFRTAIARGLSAGDKADSKTPRVDREGGHYGAGIIRGFAVITRGEALGHALWIDSEFVEQTRKAMAALASGTKSRFTHPGLSSDGMGKLLGRAYSPKTDGDTVRADLHLLESAHDTPDGDLASYVMNLAEEAPDAFGASIVYKADRGAEERFQAEHMDAEGTFKSPDPDNVNHLPHARLGRLLAVDIVDEPAANPAGMFSADAIHADLDALASYALGLSDEAPELGKLAADPDRVRGFVTRFLSTHQLKLETAMPPTSSNPASEPKTKPEETTPEGSTETKPADTQPAEKPAEKPEGETSTEPTEPEVPPPPPAEGEEVANNRGAAVAELQKFTKAFGSENGPAWFAKGYTFSQAEELHAELGRLRAQAETEANSAGTGVSATDGEPGPKNQFSEVLGDKLGGYAASLKRT